MIIEGTIDKNKNCGLAGKRLKKCSSVLSKYGLTFPPLFLGTINITLNKEFVTPKQNVIFISQQEVDSVAPGYGEWWKLIPVKGINNTDVAGYIYRTKQNVHEHITAELITIDLNNNPNIIIKNGDKIRLHV